jgi:hypothetical protein
MIESIYYVEKFPTSRIDLYDPEGWIKKYKRHWRSKVQYLERIQRAFQLGYYMEPIWVACTDQMTRVDDRVGDARFYVIVKMCKQNFFPAIVFNYKNAVSPHTDGVELKTEDDIASYYSFAGLDVRFEYSKNELVRVKPTRKVCSGWDKFPLLDGEGKLPEITKEMMER